MAYYNRIERSHRHTFFPEYHKTTMDIDFFNRYFIDSSILYTSHFYTFDYRLSDCAFA